MASDFNIGPVSIRNPVILAPMSGVSDAPFRALAWRRGAGLVISEMVASEALANQQPDSVRRITRVSTVPSNTPPHVVQLAGREARWMRLGAQIAVAEGADIVDINMGCPARKVTNGASGSALMRDLDHAERLIEATLEGAGRIPVTLKMRLGWDERSLNAPELAHRAEALGVQSVTVHGRTRCQFFKGRADWRAVAKVRSAVTIPLVVNGDIANVDDARTALSQSGADAVMVGRSTYGRPYLPGSIAEALETGSHLSVPSLEVIEGDLLELHDATLSLYGKRHGTRIARKHIAWTFEALGSRHRDCGPAVTGALKSDEPNEVVSLIGNAFQYLAEHGLPANEEVAMAA
ncbi:MAG: tRNA dihydrouridine synthase DusB [Pseudomonadota bacterium]